VTGHLHLQEGPQAHLMHHEIISCVQMTKIITLTSIGIFSFDEMILSLVFPFLSSLEVDEFI
jgi:hypothetical protein